MSTSNSLTLFNYNGNRVRTILDERTGEPWWVAKDVCDVLGLTNSRQTLSKLLPDEKGVVRIDTPGGPQNMSIINKDGLYRLIFRSDKPIAEDFRTWIIKTVLPAVEKYGAPTAPQNPTALGLPDFTDPAAAAVAWAEQFSARKALEEELEEAAPKVEFYDTVAASDQLMSVEVVAKELGVHGLGRNKLFPVLRRIGWVQKGKTLPYQNTVNAGFMAVRKIRTFDGMVYDRAYVTGRGQQYLTANRKELFL